MLRKRLETRQGVIGDRDKKKAYAAYIQKYDIVYMVEIARCVHVCINVCVVIDRWQRGRCIYIICMLREWERTGQFLSPRGQVAVRLFTDIHFNRWLIFIPLFTFTFIFYSFLSTISYLFSLFYYQSSLMFIVDIKNFK